jgi:hydroxyacylglutathione hydrolase
MMLTVIPIRAFKDNYIWLLVNSANQYCAIIDPGDAEPVIDYIQKEKLLPCAILITHHHHDHSGGVLALKEQYPAISVYGPAQESIAGVDYKVVENDVVSLAPLGLELMVYDIPGHTRGHVAYYGNQMVFCGDTLFAAGCGRLFEGTADEMVRSLAKIRDLPDHTLIYCAHEYTAANLRFAEVVEPKNQAIQERKKTVANQMAQQIPSLPSLVLLEKMTNPFLRCEEISVIDAVQSQCHETSTDPVKIFRALRTWKDNF